MEPGTGDTQELRRALRDLVAISMLPAVWAGQAPQELAQSTAQVVLRTLDVDVVYVRIHSPRTGNCLEASASVASGVSPIQAPALGRLLAPWLQPDGSDTSTPMPNPVGSGTLQLAVIPIGFARQAGVLVAGARQPGFPTENERTVLLTAANQAAIVLDARWAEEELREQARTIETINRVGRAFAAELDQEQLVQAITDAATELTGAQFGSFFYNVVSEQGEAYMLHTLSGAPREAFAEFPMPRNTAVFAPTFRGDGVVRLADVTEDPRYGQNAPYYGMPKGHLPVRSYLAAPVISRTGEVLGGLFFGHSEPGMFTERAEQILAGIAAQAAVAIDNARLYGEAREAIRLRDEFLAAASHDLKNPLAAIKGTAQVLQRAVRRLNIPEAARLDDGLRRIDSTVTKMSSLIDTLLDITRVHLGQPLPLDRRDTDLVLLVRQVAEELQASTVRHRIRVDTTVPELIGLWDAARLERMLSNLVNNAIKYSPEGGEIEITASVDTAGDEPCAVLVVRDWGLGIPAADLPRIFERFQRARNTVGRIAGTGIGLTAVRQIVEEHGGQITVESQEGVGTIFAVRLPTGPDPRTSGGVDA
jgi:signal transduction histidine kinase